MTRRAAPLPPGDSLGYLVRDLNRAMQRALAERIGPRGVAPGAWYFLRVLWEEDGLTQRELAERVGMREPTAAVALRGMEEAGWVRRLRSKEDRRKLHVLLTPRGRALRQALLPLAEEVNAIGLGALTAEERRALLTLLRRARESFAKS